MGGVLSNTFRNAPFVIENYYALVGLLTLLMATAFVNSAAKGNETEVPVNDWIDIGAFAKPEKGRKYGRTLYRDRVHIAQTRSTCTFTVGELPDQAGVDPFLLLIDRLPEDNVKKVTLAEPFTTRTPSHQANKGQVPKSLAWGSLGVFVSWWY
jgi:hypothetical protein